MEHGQENEAVWLKSILANYKPVAEKALSARIFGLCCGINLACPNVIGDILEGIKE